MRNMPERIVTVTNPAGTRQGIAHRATNRLREVFGTRVVEQHTYPRQKDTTEHLKEIVQAGDVVVTLGGDGTARTAVEALADVSTPAHRAYLLPLPFGFQNDLSRQLYGGRRNDDPAEIIRDSSVVNLTPLRVTLEHEGREEYLSALYTSVGLIANAAAYLESQEFRDNWMYHSGLMRDTYSLRVLPWALAHRDPIRATIDGVEREILDATVAKIPSLARYLHPPVELIDDKACYMEIRSRSLLEIGTYVARLAAQPFVAAPSHQLLDSTSEQKVITVHDDTRIHTDGDARPIAAGTMVTVCLHDAAYQALTTRL